MAHDTESFSGGSTIEAMADLVERERGSTVVRGGASLIEWRDTFYLLTLNQTKYWRREQGRLTINVGCPGGKLEGDEGFSNAAIRESREEIGVEPSLLSSPTTTYFDYQGKRSLVKLTNQVRPFLIHCTVRGGIPGKGGTEGKWTLFSAMFRAVVSSRQLPTNTGETGGLFIIAKEKFSSFPDAVPIHEVGKHNVELRPVVDIPMDAYLSFGAGLRYAQKLEHQMRLS